MDANQPSTTDESQEPAGLLDGVTVEQQEAPTPEGQTMQHLQKDKEDDDEPLERPDWWPENFWKKEEAEPDLEAIAKSWSDLRKQISQGKHKAPADGKYDTSAFGDIPENDPVRQHVEGWAKEYGISQVAFDKLVGDVVKMGGMEQEQIRTSIEAERKALGPNGDALIKGMVTWAQGLVQKGVWSKTDFEEFKIMGGTANGIRALVKLRESYEGRIPIDSGPVDGAPSKEELYAMVGDPKYNTDKAYREKVESLFVRHFN